MPYEVSCVDIQNFIDGQDKNEFFVVGLWNDMSIRVLNICDDSINEICKEFLGGGKYFYRSIFFNLTILLQKS